MDGWMDAWMILIIETTVIMVNHPSITGHHTGTNTQLDSGWAQ